MKRTLWRVLLSTALIAGIYVASQFYLGKQLEREVGLFADQLVAHDNVRVNRLDYERGLTSGVLHYDLVVTPDGSASAAAIVASLLAALPAEGMPLQGTVEVMHGPWLGLEHGFGAARVDESFALPDELRAMLPQYPGRQPALTASAIMTLGGELQAVLRSVDYDGRMVARDTSRPGAPAESVDLVLAGLEATLKTNGNFDRADIDLSLQIFSIAGEDESGRLEISANDLAAEARWQISRPWVWTGVSELSLEQFALLSPGSNIRINDLHSANETREVDGNLEANNSITVRSMMMNETEMSDMEFRVGAGNIDAAAYSELMMLANSQVSGAQNPGAAQAAMDAALMSIMESEPWLELERLSVALVTQEDVLVTARVEVGELSSAQSIPAALLMQSEVRLTTAALRQFVRLYVENINTAALPEAELNRQSEMLYNEAVELLQIMGYAQVSADHITTALALEQGWLLINGQRVFNVNDWFSAATTWQ